MTTSDLEDLATKSSLRLEADVKGPLLTLQAFPIDSDKPIGYLSAFIRPIPFGLFHLLDLGSYLQKILTQFF